MSTDSQSAAQTTDSFARESKGVPAQRITGKRVLLNWFLFFAGYAAIMAVSYWLFR